MAGVAVKQRPLYGRMEANLLASWEEYAAGAEGASLERLRGAVAAIFPAGPERDVYNNALLSRGLDTAATADALIAIEDAYDQAGVAEYAVWVHGSQAASIAALGRRGYHIDTCTRAMAMPLDEICLPRPRIAVAAAGWDDYLAFLTDFGVPEGLLAGVDGGAFDVLIATLDGVPVAVALAYDHGGDCGIYNVGTLPHARRRGFGTALTALLLHRARDRGCTTASLQSTPMAEHIYAAAGFRDLGRFLEFVR